MDAITPDGFSGTDSERIAAAVREAEHSCRRVRIPRMNAARGAALWLLDHAVTLPSGMTLELDGARLKLSDSTRDNIIRSANCGVGINPVAPARDIRILGRDGATLEGADRPRATGDSGKTLSPDPAATWPLTYGTDAGQPGEKQTGDWRNIGVLLASIEGFVLEGVRIVNSHAWAISLEWCSHGTVRDIVFDSHDGMMIDGAFRHVRNQDGLDLRKGCHDIAIENISGTTGDDLIALTAIPHAGAQAGGLDFTEVSATPTAGEPSPDVRHITIRNVRGYSAGGHHIVRFLNTSGVAMHDIILDGLVDTSPAGHTCHAAVKIGDSNKTWGGVTPLGDTRRFIVRNILSRAKFGVLVAGSLCDAVVDGVIQDPACGTAMEFQSGQEYLRNVLFTGILPPRQDRGHA